MRDEKTYVIIGAAIEVHKKLGCGFLEAVYQEALEKQFAIQSIPFKSQPIVEIKYKGELLSLTLLVGQQVLDLPARALTPICFFKHALNSPNNLFFQYVLMSRMAGG